MEASGASFHTVELEAHLDSKITAVTLYPYQADVTRTFHCQLDSGLTRVRIPTGFPPSFDKSRLRIEVVGDASLTEVITVWAKDADESKDDRIEALYEKKSRLENSLARCKRMTTALETYAQIALDKQSGLNPLDIQRFLDSYEEAGTKWDTKTENLEKEIQEIQDKIYDEEESGGIPDSPNAPEYSRSGITFALSTEGPKTVSVKITYGVSNASWNSAYDVFAQPDKQNLTLVYKATIYNNTGESWEIVDLTLGTVVPVVLKPQLQRWRLSLEKKPNPDPYARIEFLPPKPILGTHQTFNEKVTVLDKANTQALVLARYLLTTNLSWLCTPRISSSVYIQAKVTNTSNHALRAGNAAVYFSDSFIASVYIPLTNPGEIFNLSLGTDPDIHVTYHPRLKVATTSDSPSPLTFKPVVAYLCSQRITVTNSRGLPTALITVVDSIPTVEDLDIFVKLIHPPLKYPDSGASGFKDLTHAENGIPVTDGIPTTCDVHARWDTVDEPIYDLSLLGDNGKINWVCRVPGKESVDLNLQWEVLVYSTRQIKDL